MTERTDEQAGALAIRDASSTALALMTREQSEMQAAVLMARKYPRDEDTAGGRILKACGRATFAERAMYALPRGGERITGPSVQFAREAARCWGNIRHGFRVVDFTPDRTTLEGYALDLETNTLATSTITFRNLIYRKGKGWIQPDERDYRELVGRQGAICQRNAILQVIPPDVTEDGMAAVQRTQRLAAKGELDQDRDQAIRRLVAAFLGYGVAKDHLEAFLDHSLSTMTAEELATLRGMYRALEDGADRAENLFPSMQPAKPAAGPKVDPLDALAGTAKAQPPAPAAPAQPAEPPAMELPPEDHENPEPVSDGQHGLPGVPSARKARK